MGPTTASMDIYSASSGDETGNGTDALRELAGRSHDKELRMPRAGVPRTSARSAGAC